MTFPIKKKNLISIVQSMQGFSSPKVQLEQYLTDAVSTVDFLYYVGIDNQDIFDKITVDLGAGTGRLGLTSLLMGAKHLIAVEKDILALEILQSNAKKLNLTSEITILPFDISKITVFQLKEIQSILEKLSETDTEVICIMNPPFGVQIRNADRPFLILAMQICDRIYSIHLSNPKTRKYFQGFAKSRGWVVSSIHSQKMILEGSFEFHTKKRKEILTDVYKLEKKKIR